MIPNVVLLLTNGVVGYVDESNSPDRCPKMGIKEYNDHSSTTKNKTGSIWWNNSANSIAQHGMGYDGIGYHVVYDF